MASNSWVASLHPFFEEHFIPHVGGRLQNLTDSRDVKHILLLLCRQRFTELEFAGAHCRVMHAGEMEMINSVRMQFWSQKHCKWRRKQLFDACYSHGFTLNPSCRRIQHVPPAGWRKLYHSTLQDLIWSDGCMWRHQRAPTQCVHRTFHVYRNKSVGRGTGLGFVLPCTAVSFPAVACEKRTPKYSLFL